MVPSRHSTPTLLSKMFNILPAETQAAPTGKAEHASNGTVIANILLARRGSIAPAICPECRLLVRPVFDKADNTGEQTFNTTPERLARAITEVTDAGARILNL